MVEMLCVLGIMGVLSIAGISGYNYLVNKHRVNELHADALERAIAVSSQLVMGKEHSLSAFRTKNKTAAGNFDSSVNRLDQDHFAIQINNVSKKVFHFN